MKVQALTSFVGEVVMANGEVKDVDDTTGKDFRMRDDETNTPVYIAKTANNFPPLL